MKNIIFLLGLALIAGCSGSPVPRNPMHKECDAECDANSDTETASLTSDETCLVFPSGTMAHVLSTGNVDWSGPCRYCNLDLNDDGYMDAIANVHSER